MISFGTSAGCFSSSNLLGEDIPTAQYLEPELKEHPAGIQKSEEQPQELPAEAVKERKPHFVSTAPGFGHRIALTYDDGPTPSITNSILNDLEKRKLRATFFMIGNKVKAYKSLANEVAAAGHEVANHTYTHPNLKKLSSSRVEYEIHKTQEVIEQVTGKVPTWFRPPYGAFHKKQGEIPMGEGLGIAYWSVDPRDWARPGASRIVSHIYKNTTPGSIVLLHDLHKQTADATPDVLDRLLERSFNFTTMSGILGEPYHA